MSGTTFDQYDEEFKDLSDQAKASLSEISRDIESAASTHDVEPDLRRISNLLNQADDILKQMTLEAREADDAALKKSYLNKVRVCKAILDNLKDDYKTTKNEADRASLMSGAGGKGDYSSLSNDAKQRLLSTNETLSKQNDTLENAKRVMAETEEVAYEITEELGRHREKIQSAHSKVKDMGGLTNRARRILHSMNRREIQQRIVVYAIALIILIVFIFLLVKAFT